MKKFFSLFLVLLLLMTFVSPVFAAGKMTTGQENLHVVDLFSIYGYVFAKVENTGDKPVEFSAGLLELYDTNGDALTSTDYIYCYPKYLQPGETGYVYAYDQIEDAESCSVVADYSLTVTGKNSASSIIRYPATGEFQPDVQISKYLSYDYITAQVTNNTDSTVFNIKLVSALLDDNDNILYVAEHDFYDTGINPGSTVTYRDSISSSWLEAWEREGVTPTHVDVIAYSNISEY